MIFIKNKAFLLLFSFLTLFLILGGGCKSTVEYRTKPLSTPPSKYYISDYKTKKELYFEYQHSLKTIKEWQLWYNVNVGSNYYNYKDITNINDFNIELTNSELSDIVTSRKKSL